MSECAKACLRSEVFRILRSLENKPQDQDAEWKSRHGLAAETT